MHDGKPFEIDHAAVAAELEKAKAEIVGGIYPALFRRVTKATVSMFAAFVLLRSILGTDELFRPGYFLREVVGGALMVVGFMIPVLVVIGLRHLRRVRGMTPGEFASRLEESHRHHAGMEWVGHALLTGFGMALAIGIPVGALMAFTGDPADLMIPGQRWASVVAFTGITMSWTLPMAFIIRWFELRRTKRFIVG
jgi:hypothetical protein